MPPNGENWKMDAMTKFVPRSTNRKLGPMPCSYVDKSTCPPSCPLMGAGCYGEAGPVSIHWNNVKTPWRAFLGQIKAIPAGMLWRHAVAGDLPGKGNSIDTGQLWQLIHANGDSRGFTYTHKPLSNLYKQTVKRINEKTPFTINLSADSLADADRKAAWNVGPVAVVVPSGITLATSTPKGRSVMICPATYNPQINCQSCRICATAKRDFIVGFPAHGTRKNMINERLKQNRQGETVDSVGV
tara:strand:- start:125 stop:850 length:726 start_codon:yes stop_codon:yes gene_type:complete